MIKEFLRTLLGYKFPDNPYNPHTWVTGKPEVGKRVWIGAFCLIDGFHDHLKIGDFCEISSGVEILTHSTLKRCISERIHNQVDHAPTEIGDACFIGTHATILMGSKIGHHSVIGAGAVVPQFSIIPSYSIVTGVPAKIVGSTKKYLRGVEKMGISIVMPAYNEQSTIEKVADEATVELKKLTKNYEIVLVDDGSKDKTTQIIKKLSRKKNIRAIYHKKNMGFSVAIKSALYGAKKHLIFLAPADGQFDFKELGKFVEGIKGYDVAVGYRTKNDESIIRKINFEVFRLLSRFMFGITLKDFTNVSMWRKPVLEKFDIEAKKGDAMFLTELVYKALHKKYKFAEVPVIWRKRKGGKPKGGSLTMIIKTVNQMISFWNTTRNKEI